MVPQKHIEPSVRRDTLTIPELEQSKAAVLNTLASVHSRRSYAFAIDRFIAWYCSEPRLTFNRAVVVRYRSHLEGLSLSSSTINSHLSAIRRLADESAESGWLTPELAIGIRRVQGVKRLGRKIGNWLSRSQSQELVNAASKADLRGRRDGAIVGLLLGCAAALLVQAIAGCMALAFGDWRGTSIQKSFESGKATRGWRDRERGLVCGQAMRPTGRNTQSGAPRPSSHLRPALPRLQRRTRTDSISAWPRFGADNGAIHRQQTETAGCG